MAAEEQSPKCRDGRHFQCESFWWVEQDKIALTCRCWCHQTIQERSGP